MELLMISKDKLKLTLTREDMDAYRLDAGSLDWSAPATRRAVKSILADAGRRCGFDASRERMLVQAFPSSAGGCELFVTRLCNGGGRFSAGNVGKAQAFVFDEMDDMLSCCSALCRAGYDQPSAAYSCDDGRYLLIICGEWEAARENGRLMSTDKAELYIGEHTKKIRTRDAVGSLAELR